jgi:hypothetical protein
MSWSTGRFAQSRSFCADFLSINKIKQADQRIVSMAGLRRLFFSLRRTLIPPPNGFGVAGDRFFENLL